VRVPTQSATGSRVAPIVIAATVGALLMLGARRGGPLELLAAGGQLIAPGLGREVAAIIGALIHGAWMWGWSALFAAISPRPDGWRVARDAAVVAVIAFIAVAVLPDALMGPAAALVTSERIFLHLLLALALVTGMRLAHSG
jgi:hypothetical protein